MTDGLFRGAAAGRTIREDEELLVSTQHPTGLSRQIDPVTFSVLVRRLEGIADEMTLGLEMSSWTTLLALNRDFSCAIYDAVPRQACMHEANTVHTTSLHIVIAQIAGKFAGTIRDGDVFLCNDPYGGNTHVGDIVAATPVFSEGRHVLWSVAKAHHMDVGAFVASSCTAASRDIWQEGIQIPPVRIAAAGARCEDVLELFLANVRYREHVEGDLMAQLGSIETGRRRLVELCEEYGTEEIVRYVDEIIAYADRRMAAAVREIPDGSYAGQSWVDSDGTDVTNIPVHVRVDVAGEEIVVDLEGSGPQARGGMNGTYATTVAAATTPFLLYTEPDIPHNHGCISHVTVRAPEGTIVNARSPASTSAATMVPSAAITAAVHRAMAHAIPDLVAAGSARSSHCPQFFGVDQRTGREWAAMIRNGVGGSGANGDADGWPAITNDGAGGLKVQSIEQIELIHPLLVEQMEIEPESHGYGTHNGAPGTRFAVRPIAGAMHCITFGDGCENPPHGIVGGSFGAGGGCFVENRTTGRRRFTSASGLVHVATDEAWVGVSTGGGGWGTPLQRDAELVRREVRDGLFTVATAAEVFGVVVAGGEGDDPVLDTAATASLRARLRAERSYPLVSPGEAGASTWAREQMRDGDVYLLNPDEE
jgi:N-methylhydantoinase B